MIRRIALILLLIVSVAKAVGAGEIYGVAPDEIDFYAGDVYLSKWMVPEARAAIDRLLAKSPAAPASMVADAHVAFFEGRYKYALDQLDRAGFRGEFRNLVKTTYDATKGMKSKKSRNFEVFWSDPRDELLADGAIGTLEAAREALGKELGYVPELPVRLEIYPTTADFTAVSTLTRREVDTTGIIGLCKFDRLLVTSPRVAVWGYRWRDTISHEYAHLVIYRMSGGDAPIWLHEGIAKHVEGAWRGRVGKPMSDVVALLAQNIAKGKLIGLEQMSPSIAKLPSAEDAALAFAEVETMMAFLTREKGSGALPEMLKAIAAGKSDREALEAVWGQTFADFEAKWRNWAETLPKTDAAVEVVSLELKENRDDTETAADTVTNTAARDFVRLGDMLRVRDRIKAASEEYAKAFALAPKSPVVASRQALGRMAVGDYAGVLAAVDPVLDLYADMAVLWARKGDALFGLGKYEEAKAAYLELMDINPFHLPGRIGLYEVAEKTGDKAGAESAKKSIGLLMQHENALEPGHGPKAGE